MRYRVVKAITVLSLTVAGVMVAQGTVATQPPAPAATGNKGTSPRASDGHPDLQGVWSYATTTPLERPKELGERQTLTKEELAEAERQAEIRAQVYVESIEKVGSYNKEWFDWGKPSDRSSLIVDPSDGRIPPVLPEAQKRAAARAEARRGRGPADSWLDRSLGERCILMSGPPMMSGAYNSNVQLFQTHDYLVILNEMIHSARVVPLDGRPHGTIRQWVGDSRGRWEGDTMVVDTINFAREPTFRGGSANLHLIERFRRVDADTLQYEFTVDDPTTWARSWTAQTSMKKLQERIYEYACHEGNYGLANMLAAARAEEAAAAKSGTKK